ncbi:hypothetical protein BH11MYX3_BH11MYX3_30490 [soil metagenome]
MLDQRIRYCGRYVYGDDAALVSALRAVGSLLASEDSSAFLDRGTTLIVNLGVRPAQEHRFVAANLFLVLAHGAISGSFHKVA